MQVAKQMFAEQLFAGPSLTMGCREDFGQMGLAELLPGTH